jgi:DNA-binding MarR family transcriptional regulator
VTVSECDRLQAMVGQLLRLLATQGEWSADGVAVTPTEALLLIELLRAGRLSQQDLAGRLEVDKSRISRLAAGLERRALLARERDPDNRRLYRLELTEAGSRTARALSRTLRERHERIFAEMTDDERAGLLLGMNAFIRELHCMSPWPR